MEGGWNGASGQRNRVESPAFSAGHLPTNFSSAYFVPLLSLPSGPARDTQPTMKFVMDTSKYWFKPSITREQGEQNLGARQVGPWIMAKKRGGGRWPKKGGVLQTSQGNRNVAKMADWTLGRLPQSKGHPVTLPQEDSVWG